MECHIFVSWYARVQIIFFLDNLTHDMVLAGPFWLDLNLKLGIKGNT